MLFPVTYGHIGHTMFTLPRSNPRDWGLEPTAAGMYETWPDVSGTDYAERMPSNYHQLRFNVEDDAWALPRWKMHKDPLSAENPPPFTRLEPIIPAEFL